MRLGADLGHNGTDMLILQDPGEHDGSMNAWYVVFISAVAEAATYSPIAPVAMQAVLVQNTAIFAPPSISTEIKKCPGSI